MSRRAAGIITYGQKEIDLLHQILFYRELGIPLDEIKNIVCSEKFDKMAALEGHLAALKAKREQIEGAV